MANYQKIGHHDIYEQLNCAERLGRKDKESHGTQNSQSRKSDPNRKENHEKRKGVHKGPKKDKLTTEQKKRIATLMTKKGTGEYVGKEIYYNDEWWEMVKNENLCRKCARKGHTAKDCPLPKPESASNGNKINAISELVSEMENDFSYLCSLGEDIPLAMFPCAVNVMSNSDGRTGKQNVFLDTGSSDHHIVFEQNGIALTDTGATRNYISRRFAARAGLSYEGVSTSKTVRLPNG